MKVGIVGAGIGGTCLAHGLQRQNIDVIAFERNPKASVERPGYGIHINPFGQEAMRECLPLANWQRFLEASKPIGSAARFYDTDLSLLATQEGSHEQGDEIIRENRLSISRMELKEVLNAGLEDVIRHEKRFVRFENRAGGVEVYFADGTSEVVDVLIAADGANSKVRQQYLPTIERFDVGVDIIVGRTRLTPELAKTLPAELIDGSPNSIVPTSPDWMFASVWRAPVDTTGSNPDLEIDSYAVWAYIAGSLNLPSDIGSLSAKSLRDLALARTAGWSSNLHRLISQSDLPSVSFVPLKSMPHLAWWPTTRVTLLGDAIHNMTPMAGVGANTALRDARVLTRAFASVQSGHQSLIKALTDYESEMRNYANPAVSLSLRNARNAGRGSMPRHIFRSLLRLAELVPPIKQKLFPAGM